MSTSPLQPDPYEALGVARDVDSDTIKKAHRKLVLKHHPDRIKDPALVEQGKNEFQKVQQAYELLIDPIKRQRYEDECKLAQLRRERMMAERDAPRPMPMPTPTYTRTTYTARPSPAPTHPVQREVKPDGRYAFEERAPESYFDSVPRGMYEEPLARGNARKDPYEKRPSVPKPAEKKEKDKPKSSQWEKPIQGMSMRMAFGLKEKAQSAKEKAKQAEVHAKNAKARDKEERRERSEKKNPTYSRYSNPQVDDDYSSDSEDSDSDTVLATPRGQMSPRARSPRPMTRERSPAPKPLARERSPKPSPKPMTRERSPVPKSKRQSSPEPLRRRQPSPQPPRGSVYDEESDDADEWERRHRDAGAYIAQAQSAPRKAQPPVRPSLSRTNSEHVYWAADASRDHRRSGSDSDKQRPPSSHKQPRRSMPPEDAGNGRRPPLNMHTSAPSGLKTAVRSGERESPMPRSRQGSYDSRIRGPMFGEIHASLKRTSSDPVSPSTATKRDNMPTRGSTLKHAETNHDSGYGSSSTPHTPEMREESPFREAKAKETKTTYRAKRDEEDTHRARKMTTDGGEIHRFLSPEMAQQQYQAAHPEEKRERRPSRSRDPEPQSRPSRPAQAERRPSMSRAGSSSRHDERRSRPAEKSPDRGYTRGVDPNQVKYATQRPPTYARYDSHSHHQHRPDSFQRQGRKASVF